MDSKTTEDVPLETMEEAENQNKKAYLHDIPKQKVFEWGNTRKGYWRVAKSPILHSTLDNRFWKSDGLVSLKDRYNFLRNVS